MIPLIDADILRYEVGAIGELDGEIKSFDYVAQVLDGRIDDICAKVGATEPPILYLTEGKTFRDEVAVTKPYKGTRKDEKPFHHRNLTVYMENKYYTCQQDGLEADDMMCVHQTAYAAAGMRSIICSRDKDLRQCPGMHYSWECGASREFGPHLVHPDGYLSYDPKKNKLTGTGDMFFYAQMLMGDDVDNIPGCKGIGPKRAYLLLKDCETPKEAWDVVRDLYFQKHDEAYLMEQADLLYMIRELYHDDTPVRWRPPS